VLERTNEGGRDPTLAKREKGLTPAPGGGGLNSAGEPGGNSQFPAVLTKKARGQGEKKMLVLFGARKKGNWAGLP